MSEITLLDGGMGQELLSRTGATPTDLWSTQVMMDNPEAVRETHDDYFAAGADIATTNTYGILLDRLEHAGIEDQLEALHLQACTLANQARDGCGREVKIAGSLGPLGWSYRPDLAPSAERAAEQYAVIAAIQAPFVDFFLCETMASVDQARGAVMGASSIGKPVWLAVTVDDDDGTKLRSGEPLLELEPLIREFSPAALLINCSTPESTNTALPELSFAQIPLGAYANGFTRITREFLQIGTTVEALDTREDLGPQEYADFVETWIELGATIVGGCCEVGPAHIAEISRRLSL